MKTTISKRESWKRISSAFRAATKGAPDNVERRRAAVQQAGDLLALTGFVMLGSTYLACGDRIRDCHRVGVWVVKFRGGLPRQIPYHYSPKLP